MTEETAAQRADRLHRIAVRLWAPVVQAPPKVKKKVRRKKKDAVKKGAEA